MESLLVEPSCFSPPEASLAALVPQLLREVAALRAEVEHLRRENLELRQQAGYWKSQHAAALRRFRAWEQENEQLQAENRKLQAQLFGRKSEKHPLRDRSNQLEDPDEPHAPKRKRGQQPGRPGPKRRDYTHLPVRVETIELDPAARRCPQCGQALAEQGECEDSEQIELEVRAYRRLLRRRRYRRTCSCGGTPRTVTAPVPAKLIPKGRYGISIWVAVLLDKYQSYRPTERLLQEWRFLGLDLAPGTVADGLQYLEPFFQPVYDALLQRNVQSPYCQADETRWLVLVEKEGKIGYRWWLWVFLGTDTVVYRLDSSRSHIVPEDHFSEQTVVILMVDRYAAYKAMAQVKEGTILLAFCWAHQRRDFVALGKGWEELKPWALAWLRRIRNLYRLNQQRLAQPRDAAASAFSDTALRQAVQAMAQQRDAELADPQLRAPCRKVLQSLQEHWEGLTRFVDDPRIPMDNNASERRARGPALGRKNYSGSGSLWSGRLAAMLFSIFATLSLAQLNPRKWLTWYLQGCAAAGGQAPASIDPYLPWNLSAAQREEFRDISSPKHTDSS